jgi:hypothetical protein
VDRLTGSVWARLLYAADQLQLDMVLTRVGQLGLRLIQLQQGIGCLALLSSLILGVVSSSEWRGSFGTLRDASGRLASAP